MIGDVILYGMESTFELTYEANETLILEKAQDGDMLEVVITLVTGNHNVAITCQPSTQTYSTNVYRTDDQSASTALEIETLIDGSFSTISFTNSN